jgi:L-fucose mutarotase
MLLGLHPLLTGSLLKHLDAMGHGDTVLVCDAHFPAERLGERVVEMPGADAVAVTTAIRTVLPLDTPHSASLMDPQDVDAPAVAELREACGAAADAVDMLERFAFYEAAREAFVIVRTGERRVFGNILLRKGVVQ